MHVDLEIISYDGGEIDVSFFLIWHNCAISDIDGLIFFNQITLVSCSVSMQCLLVDLPLAYLHISSSDALAVVLAQFCACNSFHPVGFFLN